MTDEQWQALAPFAEAVANARAAFAAAQAMNTPTDPKARIEADMQFQRITIEIQQASLDFESARKRILGE